MEPQIQYATTSDGVNIAFCTLGEGVPLVHMPQPITHLQLEWEISDFRRWYERLARFGKLVRYDTRGVGLSDRNLASLSFDDLVLDLEAVVDSAGVTRFALLGFQHLGTAAITYAARHPERVSHLILWGAYSKASEFGPGRLEATRALIGKDWELYTETAAGVIFGWEESEQARRFAELTRQSVTPEFVLATLKENQDVDVSELLPQVQVPTLVLHRREVPWPDLAVARSLTSRIPNSRLAILEGESVYPAVGDMEEVAAVIEEFVTGRSKPTPAVPSAEAEGIRTILFTDIEGSARMIEQLGDARARELMRAHDSITRQALEKNEGIEIKHTGDGFLASFTSAAHAIECAVELQNAFEKHSESTPESPLRIRIGLNAGEPVAENGDLFGAAVHLAARICATAEPGQILTSNVVRELAAGKEFEFTDRGEAQLRGFEEPVRLHEVAWHD